MGVTQFPAPAVGGNTGFEIIDSQTFTASGTWSKPAGTVDTDWVVAYVIAGGAAGGNLYGGGGGQGLVLILPAIKLSASEAVVVGAGGATAAGAGENGGDSSFAGFVSLGGLGTDYGSSRGGGYDGGIKVMVSGDYKAEVHPGKFGGGAGGNSALTLLANGQHAHFGAGGGAVKTTGSQVGGKSMFAGNGADAGGSAGVPGGGGAGDELNSDKTAGARGEVCVWVVRGTIPSLEAVVAQ